MDEVVPEGHLLWRSFRLAGVLIIFKAILKSPRLPHYQVGNQFSVLVELLLVELLILRHENVALLVLVLAHSFDHVPSLMEHLLLSN